MAAISALLLPCCCRAPPCSATATLTGQVVDPQGAAIPAANITVRNTDVATSRTLTAALTEAFALRVLSPVRTPSRHARARCEHAPPASHPHSGQQHRNHAAPEIGSPGNNPRQSLRVAAPWKAIPSRHPPTPLRPRSAVSFPASPSPICLTATVTSHSSPIRQPHHGDPEGTGVSIAGQRSRALAVQVDGTSFLDPLLGGRRGADDGAVLSHSAPCANSRSCTAESTPASATQEQDSSASPPSPARTAHAATPSTRAARPVHLRRRFRQLARQCAERLWLRLRFTHPQKYTLLFCKLRTGLRTRAPLRGVRSAVSRSSVPDCLARSRVRSSSTNPPHPCSFASILSQRNTLMQSSARPREPAERAGQRRRPYAYSRHPRPRWQLHRPERHLSLWLSTVLSALLQALVAYSNDHRLRTPVSLAPEYFINGFGILGGDTDGPHLYTSKQLQLIEDVTLTRGRNELTFGGRLAVAPPTSSTNKTSMPASTTLPRRPPQQRSAAIPADLFPVTSATGHRDRTRVLREPSHRTSP